MYTGKFHTLVFSRKKIIRFFVYFVSGVLIALFAGIVYSCTNTADRISVASGNMYMAILESELPVEQDEGAQIKRILGFDVKNPKTILSAYSALFGEVKKEDKNDNITPDQPVRTPVPSEAITAGGGMKLTNATPYSVDMNKLAEEKLPFSINDDGPQVLIVHTHTTESYSDDTVYTSSDRSTDEMKNIVAVGNVFEKILNENGISVIHDTTVHDYPSYNGAYTRALTTIKKNLGQYPSIKIVLDIHRDGIVRSDGTKVKVIADVNGMQCAQVMIVAGSDAGGLSHDNWRDNMNFAAHIQKKANEMYPSLMRPVNLREERFNTHMTKGSIIMEIGSNGNTLEEAKLGARYAAEAVCAVLNNKQRE